MLELLKLIDLPLLIISSIVAGVIFVIIKSKFIKKSIYKIKNIINYNKINNELTNIMNEDNVNFEEAKKVLFLEEIIKALEIDEDFWQINRHLILNKGDRVSFMDSEVGLVQGTFLGIKKSELIGYDDIYVVRDTKKSTIRQASISYVKEETINVYK